jgi:hypothetical protein
MKKSINLGLLSLLMVFILSGAAFSQINGSVDWVNRQVKVKGIGAGPEGPNQRPMAIRAAKQVALRDALELIKGMTLNSQTTIANSMVQSDQISTSISGFVKGFPFEPNPHYMSDGTVEIEVTMPIDGNNGVAGALFGGDVNMIAEKPTATFGNNVGSVSGGACTGLIIDAKGLSVKPALMPKVLSEADKEIYGSAWVTRDFAVKFGMCGYAKNLDNAKQLVDRIGKNPCVVKGIKAGGANKADIVISNQDALTVQGAAKSQNFLAECRVIVIID